jgi:hypothetical protein
MGRFFHIDFGHFLGHSKKMIFKKVVRDREPFIYSPELHYFLINFDLLYAKPPKPTSVKRQSEKESLFVSQDTNYS